MTTPLSLLNFGHPLTADQLAQTEALTGQAITRVIDLAPQFDLGLPFAPQAEGLADSAGLTPEEWQTAPLLVNPPALNLIAVTLLAHLHGRMGYFPAVVRLRPARDANPPRFEVAEIVNLHAVREAARERRQDAPAQ